VPSILLYDGFKIKAANALANLHMLIFLTAVEFLNFTANSQIEKICSSTL
jgi:hypothetical protein